MEYLKSKILLINRIHIVHLMNVIYYKHVKFILNARGQIKNIYMKLFLLIICIISIF